MSDLTKTVEQEIDILRDLLVDIDERINDIRSRHLKLCSDREDLCRRLESKYRMLESAVFKEQLDETLCDRVMNGIRNLKGKAARPSSAGRLLTCLKT